jgi:steroid delta-isomerase-like uncharacterized protein
MDAVVERHLAAEAAGGIDGAVAVYSDDVEHDVVGWPTGPAKGRDGARGFYEYLAGNFRTGSAEVTRRWYAEDALVVEHDMRGVVTGELLGLPGHGREIGFRILHVFEFDGDRIRRENVWLDGATIQAQLAPPPGP